MTQVIQYKVRGQELLTPDLIYPRSYPATAQLGGTVATNASERSFRFGATRCSIYALSIITPNAETFYFGRGEYCRSHKV